MARELLKQEKLVLDWKKRQQSRAAVFIAVQDVLDKLPRAFGSELYEEKHTPVSPHVYDSYADAQRSIYGTAA